MQYVIVGLGNPGKEYTHTRHNIGVQALEQMARVHGFSDWKHDSKKESRSASGTIGGAEVTLVFPQTFMNASGRAVKKYIPYPKDVAKLIVIHDELDIPIGQLKVSFGKSSGGHNGVQSIIESCGTDLFTRIRIGIGSDHTGAEYVLNTFTPEEKETLEHVLKEIPQLVEVYIKEGREKAMNLFN